MKITALIMAGGRGERFWPRSRKKLPKQFLSLTDDDRTMIQLTVDRILPLVDMEDIYIATNRDYKPLVREQLPGIPGENILCEPVGRNTAPCIGLGATHISKKYEDAVMMVLPSDSLIKNADRYLELAGEACGIADDGNNLVTMGIRPSYPETGYGYIKFRKEERRGSAYKVDRFVEKPSADNFIFGLLNYHPYFGINNITAQLKVILELFKQYLPDMKEGLDRIGEAIGTGAQDETLENIFPGLESISVDYGIMEKAQSIYTIPGDFGWDDVGSWLAVERIRAVNEENNVVSGNVVTIDTKDCIIEGSDKLIAAVVLKDTVIVDTEDAILICDKNSTADIKKVLASLRDSGHDEVL